MGAVSRAVLVCLLAAGALSWSTPSARSQFYTESDVLKELQKPDTSEGDFIATCRRLTRLPAEPSTFWTDIVSNPSFPDRRRQWALYLALRRHLVARSSLWDLAERIPMNTLLNASNIVKWDRASGEMVPSYWGEGRVFRVQFVPGPVGTAGAASSIAFGGEASDLERLLRLALCGVKEPKMKEVQVIDFRDDFNWAGSRRELGPSY